MLVQRTDRLTDQVVDAMQAKYGPPAVRGTMPAWNARPATETRCCNGRDAPWETWVEAGKPTRVGATVYNEAPELVVPYPDQGGQRLDYAQCGPLLRAKIGNGGSGFPPEVTEIPVYVFLQDMGVMAWLGRQPGAVLPPPPPPAMKF